MIQNILFITEIVNQPFLTNSFSKSLQMLNLIVSMLYLKITINGLQKNARGGYIIVLHKARNFHIVKLPVIV